MGNFPLLAPAIAQSSSCGPIASNNYAALYGGDRIILATDGVTDNVTSCELVEIMRRAVSPDEVAGQLHSILTTRQAEGRLPAPLGGRFRDDDWTAIIRFFGATSARASTIDLPR
jgi:hypothetical protein